jgi:hypothetical protein
VIVGLVVVASAGAISPAERAYALVIAMVHAEQATLDASGPVERCTVKGHRECLPAAARHLARVATAEQTPVRRATRLQRTGSCSRRAGNQYLKSLRLLRKAALALSRAKTRSALIAAADILASSDRLQTSAATKARRCWEALQQ